MDLDPDYAPAHHSFAHLLDVLGRHTEATQHFRRAAELEPLAPTHLECLGSHYVKLNRYDEAEKSLKQALEWEPNFVPAHFYLAWVAERQGNLPGAIGYAEEAVRLSNRDPSHVSLLGYYAALNGETQRARDLLNELLERQASSSVAILR